MTLLIGSVGALLLLVAFALEKFGVLKNDSSAYDVLNLVGAGFLTWYAFLLNCWPFIILEGVWALVALYYIGKRLAGGSK